MYFIKDRYFLEQMICLVAQEGLCLMRPLGCKVRNIYIILYEVKTCDSEEKLVVRKIQTAEINFISCLLM